LESAHRPVPHWDEIPVPVFFSEIPDISKDESSSVEESENDVMFDSNNAAPQPLSQKELNHLVRDLSLTKTCSELLASRLKGKNLLSDGVRVTFYRSRHNDYLPYFTEEKDLGYCIDVAQLLISWEIPCNILKIGDYSVTAVRDP